MEVNPINKKEIKWSDYKKVPILKIDGEQMVDSSGHWAFPCQLLFFFLECVWLNCSVFVWCMSEKQAPNLCHIYLYYNCKLICFIYTLTDIVDKLFQRIHPDNSVTDSDEERQWRGYGCISYT